MEIIYEYVKFILKMPTVKRKFLIFELVQDDSEMNVNDENMFEKIIVAHSSNVAGHFWQNTKLRDFADVSEAKRINRRLA